MFVLMASEFHRMQVKETLCLHNLSFYVEQKDSLMMELRVRDVNLT